MASVPRGVADIGLGYEYMRTKWISEDTEREIWNRRIALAMMNEILRAGNREERRVTQRLRAEYAEIKRETRGVQRAFS